MKQQETIPPFILNCLFFVCTTGLYCLSVAKVSTAERQQNESISISKHRCRLLEKMMYSF